MATVKNERYLRLAGGVMVVIIVVALAVYFYFSSGSHLATSDAALEQQVAEAHREKNALLAKGASANTRVGTCLQEPEDWTPVDQENIPDTIFVSVASYRDDECKDTVYDMFKKAKRPDDLYVGVVQQNKEGEEDCFDRCSECSKRKQSGHIRVINLSYKQAKGPTLARYYASKLWRGEEYYMQIDSHLKFEKHWDETLRQQIKATKDPKFVLGGYPPTAEQMETIRESDFAQTVVMCGNGFDANGLPGMQAYLKHIESKDSPPRPSFYMAAGLMCFPGKALLKVPFDPYLSYLFFGEEFLFGARMWTHGYNMYTPTRSFCSHHYGREDKPKYSTDHPESEACRRHAVQRVRFILGRLNRSQVHPDYLIDVEKYGLGQERSLSDYLRQAGIDMDKRTTELSC